MKVYEYFAHIYSRFYYLLLHSGSMSSAIQQNTGRSGHVSTVPRPKKNCTFCRMDITNIMFIRCASATCRDCDMCVHCFSRGFAVYPHAPDHPYRVMDHISTPIYVPDWGADEEIALLNAIDKFGLGNWADVAQAVGRKSEIECEEHYYTVYLQSPCAPLPDNTASLPPASGEYTSSTEAYNAAHGIKTDERVGKKGRGASSTSSSSSAVPDAVNGSNIPRTWRQKQLHAESEEDIARWRLQQQDFKAQQKGTLAPLVGYLPQRNDFEVEYLNDAEKDLADLEFRPDETKVERELKLKVLEIYNNVLDARAERKELIEKYQLLLKRDRRLTKEEKEVMKAMRPFARFLEPHEFDEMVRAMVAERALRARIEQLQVYRLNGVQTLADGANFDVDFARQQSNWLQKYNKQYVSMCAVPPGQDVEMRTALKKHALKQDRKTEQEQRSGGAKKARNDTTPLDLSMPVPGVGPTSTNAASVSVPRACVCNPSTPGACAFDISRMEGVQLLSQAEQILCVELHLIPAHYLVIKERLIRESIAHGYITQGHARNVLKIDIQCTDKILNFCVSAGLINNLKPDH